ncbi:MAG: hypothetical protein JJT99_12295 [Rhodobacteraceae bacterium]|nr:hypothetical protein [Paracoccaceae bacterium]
MERKTIIRGVALAAAGISASVLATGEFSSAPGTPPEPAQIAATPGTPGAASPKADATALADARLPLVDPERPGTESADGVTLPGDRLDLSAQMAQLDMPETARQPQDCAPGLQLDAFVDGLIDISLRAPCHARQQITIKHATLSFTATLSDQGHYTTYLPALAQDAHIRVHLEDGTELQHTLFLPEAAQHHRIALQWAGDLGVGLHGYHHDAGYGESGHIHASKPFDPDLDGAFLIRLGDGLGDAPRSAEIYSIPAAHLAQARLELELRHDARSCGRDIVLDVTQSTGHAGITATTLVLDMPGCAEDDTLVVVPISLEPAPQAPLHMSMTTQ